MMDPKPSPLIPLAVPNAISPHTPSLSLGLRGTQCHLPSPPHCPRRHLPSHPLTEPRAARHPAPPPLSSPRCLMREPAPCRPRPRRRLCGDPRAPFGAGGGSSPAGRSPLPGAGGGQRRSLPSFPPSRLTSVPGGARRPSRVRRRSAPLRSLLPAGPRSPPRPPRGAPARSWRAERRRRPPPRSRRAGPGPGRGSRQDGAGRRGAAGRRAGPADGPAFGLRRAGAAAGGGDGNGGRRRHGAGGGEGPHPGEHLPLRQEGGWRGGGLETPPLPISDRDVGLGIPLCKGWGPGDRPGTALGTPCVVAVGLGDSPRTALRTPSAGAGGLGTAVGTSLALGCLWGLLLPLAGGHSWGPPDTHDHHQRCGAEGSSLGTALPEGWGWGTVPGDPPPHPR